MDGKYIVNALLGELGNKLGAPGLQLSEYGTCGFTYKDKLELFLELPEASDVLHFYAPIMKIPQKRREKIFRELLKMNFFTDATNGATFAINDESDEIVLNFNEMIERLDQTTFETIIENFISTLDEHFDELRAFAGRQDEGEEMSTNLRFGRDQFIRV